MARRFFVIAALICSFFIINSTFSDAAGIITIPKTGQTTMYVAGDDGDLQKGEAWSIPRFVDNSVNDPLNLTVTDTLTNLTWSKEAKTPGPSACVPGVGKLWQDALDYVTCLNNNHFLGRIDWRLPNRVELQSLVNYGQLSTASWLNTQGFSSVRENEYWSSNTTDGSEFAWYVSMGDGSHNFGRKNVNSMNVWPVRGGKWTLDSLIVDGEFKLGSQSVETTSAPRQIAVYNSGATSQSITSISLTGSDADQFSISPGGATPCASLDPILAAGETCTLSLSYIPTRKGSRFSNLTVTANGQILDIPVSGRAYTTISGTVVNMSNKTAITGATITITGGATTTTDANGTFIFNSPPYYNGISEGTYTATISKAGYANTIINGVEVTSSYGAVLNVGMVTSGSMNIATPTTILYPEVSKHFALPIPISGGSPPFTISKAYGSLPYSIIMNGTGFRGYPFYPIGKFTYAIDVYDSTGGYASQEYTFNVAAKLTINAASIQPHGTKGSPYSMLVAASGGTTPYSYSLLYGALPTGLSLDATTGAVTGTVGASTTGTAFTIKVTDANGRTTTKNFSIPVEAPLVLSTARLNDAITGSTFSQTLSATGGYNSYTWGVFSGQLPTGLALDSATGVISGTATSASSQQVVLSVQDSAGRIAFKQLTINALNPLQLMSTTMPTGFVSHSYSEQIITSGGIGPYTYSYTGLMPTGLTLNTSTGVISGTPTSASSVNLTLTVKDSSYPANQSISQGLAMRTNSQITITSGTALPSARMGTSMNQATLAAAGGTSPYTWSLVSGNLPVGVSFNTSTGTISGTPQDKGDFVFTVRVTDSVGNATGGESANPDKQFLLHVSGPLSVTTTSVPSAGVGIPYGTTLIADGGKKTYSWAVVAGTLPAGLSLNSTTGAITGTPSVTTTSSVTFSVTDSDVPAQTTQKSITFDVSGTTSIVEKTLPIARINQAYSATVHAQLGTMPFSWRVSTGALPTGLSLTQSAGTAIISGIPTVAGTSNFTLEVSDSGNPTQTVSRAFSTTVYPDFAITSIGLKTAIRSTSYSDTVTVSGGMLPYTFSVTTGTLPTGLTLNSTTGAITGSVTAPAGTSATFTVTAIDGGYPAASVSKEFTIIAVDPLVISTSALQAAIQKTSYSAQLSGSGGFAPLSWSLTAGSLPQGLTLNATDGLISGTSIVCGSFNITIQLADNATVPTTVQKAFQLAVSCSNNYIASGNAGVAGATLDLGGTSSATKTSDESGNYSFGPLLNGNYTITPSKYQYVFTPVSKSVTVTNQDTSLAAFVATQDITPPTVTVSPADGIATNNAALTISGAATDANGIKSVTINGTAITVSQADGSFYKNFTLSAGTNNYTIIATDKAGNQTTATRSVMYDLTPPTLTVSPESGTLTSTATPTVSGTVTDVSGIQSIAVNGIAATVNPVDGSFAQAINVVAGANTFTVIATDKAGNQTTVTRSITLVATPPVLTVSAPTDNSKTNQTHISVSGTVSDNATVTITVNSDTPQTATISGSSYGAIITLTAGINTITVKAADPAGNITSVVRTVTCDITGPSLKVSTLADGTTTNNAILNVSGTVSDPNDVAAVTVNNATATVTNGSFSYPVILKTGANTIITVAIDALDNRTTDTRTITLDAAAPALTVSLPADNSATAQPLAGVKGTVSDTSTVTAMANNGSPQNAPLTGTEYDATVGLANGINTIAITVTDQVGATTSAVRTVAYDNTNMSLAITDPGQDITTALVTVTITGKVSDTLADTTVSLKFNNQTYNPIITNGEFSQELTFPAEGTWPIVVTASDANGHVLSVTRNIIYAVPANGSCGTSNNAFLSGIPTSYLCNSGTASAVTGNGHPWSWTCEGSNSIKVNCSATIKSWIVSPSAGSNGAIAPVTAKTIDNGITTSFTVTPASGYQVATVSGCNGSLVGTTYTTGAITGNCAVTAIFSAIPIQLAITTKPLVKPLNYTAKSGVLAFSLTSVTTLAELAKTVSSSDPWITTGVLTYAKGKGTLKYTVAANPTSKQRQGNVTIGNQSYVISQLPKPCKLTLTPGSTTPLLGTGGTMNVGVAIDPTDGNWSISVVKWAPTTITGWLQGFNLAEIHTGNSTQYLTADANTSGKPRSAVLTLISGDGKSKKTVTVKQSK